MEERLTANGKKVLTERYLRRGENGQPIETIAELFLRVAKHIANANVEPGPDGDAERAKWTSVYQELMESLRFLPNTPTFTGAGTPLGQLAACFVLPIDDDIGKESACGIFSTLHNAALIQQSGGGIGFSFSRLRPRGDLVRKSGGKASGPVSFMRVYDAAFSAIAQGGTRRGANMGVLRCDHPDIEEFITCKESEDAFTSFNISVGMTDAFMKAAATSSSSTLPLINPRTGAASGSINPNELLRVIAEHAWTNGEPGLLFLDAINRNNPVPHVYTIETSNPCVTGDTMIRTSDGIETVLDLVGKPFDTACGDPCRTGFFCTGSRAITRVSGDNGFEIKCTAEHRLMTERGEWVEAANLRVGDLMHNGINATKPFRVIEVIRDCGSEYVYDCTISSSLHQYVSNGFVSHNCGEQCLGPYESCCLGSINLAKFASIDGSSFDWKGFAQTVHHAARFLDDVITANTFVPVVPELKAAAWRVRRIGLGYMGLGDVLFMMKVRYGSPAALNWASQITEYLTYHAMRASVELAKERGPFQVIAGSVFDPSNFKWKPPGPPLFQRSDIGRPGDVDWAGLAEEIKRNGIRNGAVTCIAPTGTIGTVSGVEAYGIEPAFALSYTRCMTQAAGPVYLRYASRLFGHALMTHGIPDSDPAVQKVLLNGSCQGVEGIPKDIQEVFVVANDLSVEEHINMQAAVQQYISNAVSKTINMSGTATVTDVMNAYKLAWKMGCMGITVYRDGSRDIAVLQTGTKK